MPTSTTPPAPKLPLPIFQPSKSVPRYLLYDIAHITYLRSHHAILGVLIGTLPQIPQQSVFLGLPLELQPEEAQLLVDKGIAYIVNDRAWHDGDFRQQCGQERTAIIERLRNEGLEIAKGLQTMKKDRTRQILEEQEKGRRAAKGKAKGKEKARTRAETATAVVDAETKPQSNDDDEKEEEEEEEKAAVEAAVLFEPSLPLPPPPSIRSTSTHDPIPWAITPTTTYSLANPSNPTTPPDTTTSPKPSTINPHTYPLFAHLHAQSYYLSPGLRFGCHFSVYPGDPLRFHSHFLANAYGWDEEIELVDIVGGGRLGTGVKKGWLVGGEEVEERGGEEAEEEEEEGGKDVRGGDKVRCFSIEWGGM